MVRYLSDRVMVMFLGQVCELSPTEALYAAPRHPYTRFLLEAVPQPDPTLRDEERALLTGEVSSPVNPPSGCRFHPRCPYADGDAPRSSPRSRSWPRAASARATIRWRRKPRQERIFP